MRKFFEKYEMAWLYEYPFGEDFLRSIFKDDYMRKYSMVGDGIYNLVFIKDNIYDIEFKEVKTMLVNDGKKAFRDELKDVVITSIADGLNKLGLEFTINSGKFITFKIFNYIFKIEVIKKAEMPK